MYIVNPAAAAGGHATTVTLLFELEMPECVNASCRLPLSVFGCPMTVTIPIE